MVFKTEIVKERVNMVFKQRTNYREQEMVWLLERCYKNIQEWEPKMKFQINGGYPWDKFNNDYQTELKMRTSKQVGWLVSSDRAGQILTVRVQNTTSLWFHLEYSQK